MLRLAHYLPQIRLEQGGVVRAVLDLCKILAGRGHDVTLITSDARDVPEGWSSNVPGLPRLLTIDPPHGLFAMLSRRARDEALQALRNLDVLHLHAPWISSNLQLATLCRRIGLPYILSPHGMLDDWSMAQKTLKKRLYLAVAGNRLLRGASRIHCTARGELEQAGKWFDAARGVVLPLLVDLSEFRALPGPRAAREKFPFLSEETPTLLYLSRLHHKKGIWALLDAVALLRKRGCAVRLVMAGPGEEALLNHLERRAVELGVQDAVHLPGMIRGVEKISLYQAADLFVLPTSQENFGLVLFEALACETAVLTTRGVDIWPELQQAGAVIASADPAALAGTIARLLEDRAALRERGRRGREWVLSHLDPDRIADGYESMYREAAHLQD